MLRPKRVPWFVWYIAYLILLTSLFPAESIVSNVAWYIGYIINGIILILVSSILVFLITRIYYKKGEFFLISSRFRGERKVYLICIFLYFLFEIWVIIYTKSFDNVGFDGSMTFFLFTVVFYYPIYMFWWFSGRRNPYYDDGQPEESSE